MEKYEKGYWSTCSLICILVKVELTFLLNDIFHSTHHSYRYALWDMRVGRLVAGCFPYKRPVRPRPSWRIPAFDVSARFALVLQPEISMYCTVNRSACVNLLYWSRNMANKRNQEYIWPQKIKNPKVLRWQGKHVSLVWTIPQYFSLFRDCEKQCQFSMNIHFDDPRFKS